jgi:hypothetical protein
VEASALIDKTLRAVWLFPAAPVHPAWVGALTTPIVTWAAFLDLDDVGLVQVDACEVVLDPETYPSLGLSLEPCAPEALHTKHPSGDVISAHRLEEAARLLPARISELVESDPLGEGAVSEYILLLETGGSIILRHIMPPETLGICVNYGWPPNNSFKPNPLRGSA